MRYLSLCNIVDAFSVDAPHRALLLTSIMPTSIAVDAVRRQSPQSERFH
jgi:hypothetical protein